MSIDARLRESKRAQERLRREPVMAGNLVERAQMYKGLKTVMDEISVAGPPDDSTKSLRGAIRRLIVDAEYCASLPEN